MRAIFVLAFLALSGCSEAAVAPLAVQYGPTDDRREVYEEPAGVHRTIAETAIAMQIGAGWLDLSDPADVRITYTQTLGEAHDLCGGVRYADQIEPGTCSGTLIDDRHLLTAGHCVSGAEDCDGSSRPWVFGFAYDGPGALATIDSDDVYHCVSRVVLRDDTADYAVIELDRPVVGHAPAVIRTGPVPAVGTPLTLIGHPNGIPMKIAHGGTLRGASGDALVADVDAFSGNSGSGVFDDEGRIVAVLLSGADDYVASGSCSIVNVIDPVPAGEGENLVAVATPIDAFCATGVGSPVCDPAPAPDAGPATPDARVMPGDDASVPIDAAASVDAGAAPHDPGGCSCRIAPSRGGGAALAIAIALLALSAGRARARRSTAR